MPDDGGEAKPAWPSFEGMPLWLQQELRSDHAGEYGAVMIYRGVLAVSRDESVRQFAEHHLLTEQKHLALMDTIIPASGRTRLLPVWRVMGWLTGALPALLGRQAVFATIEAVETFVDHHYEQQLVRLNSQGEYGALRQVLVDCQADEVSHRDEATQLASPDRSWLLRLWCAIVGSGSAAAVVAAKRI
jgi:ubiquinone biosynthesis monooxygenase Coq7